jgi:signal transduction histidine kinase
MSDRAATTGSGPASDLQNGVNVVDLAGLIHELNNPLFAILGHVEFALREAEPGSATEERMRIIQRTGLEIKDILRGTLEASRQAQARGH